jgi:hypothetical protein
MLQSYFLLLLRNQSRCFNESNLWPRNFQQIYGQAPVVSNTSHGKMACLDLSYLKNMVISHSYLKLPKGKQVESLSISGCCLGAKHIKQVVNTPFL